ncbi:SAM-dependent methyltransferase [Streptomyces sp. NPDC002308]
MADAVDALGIEPIGTVVGGRREVADDHWGGVESVIRLRPDFPPEVVRGLEEFSHLVVVWHFDRADPDDVALHARSPRNNPAWPPTGTFAHRNHRRPNQLATSFPRLLGVDGLDLRVADLDAVDGTPVYDLAPWFAAMGPRGPVHEPAWPGEMLAEYWAEGGDPVTDGA